MIKKLINKAALLITMLALLIVPSGAVLAAGPNCAAPDTLTTKEQAKCGVDKVGGKDTGNGGEQVPIIIKDVINILLFLIGLIAVLMIVIAGFRFVTSNGDANTVSSARNTILYAVIGIVIAVMAYAIVNFVLINIT
ncbi:hypothetical protein HY004_02470 [Candidatus Saccharibacteria bacterium]|nr:hypothetical protein [Candidatus Saccharibacteria bacterium]